MSLGLVILHLCCYTGWIKNRLTDVGSGIAFVHLLLIGLRHGKMMKSQSRLYDIDVVQQSRSMGGVSFNFQCHMTMLQTPYRLLNLILLVDCK